jgi:hypothetical protein
MPSTSDFRAEAQVAFAKIEVQVLACRVSPRRPETSHLTAENSEPSRLGEKNGVGQK